MSSDSLYRRRRIILMLIVSLILSVGFFITNSPSQSLQTASPTLPVSDGTQLASDALKELSIKGRAPKTDYAREQFGNGWVTIDGCDTRNIILHRDLENVVTDSECHILRGILHDPYTGQDIDFTRGSGTSDDVQIDHVVALSDAWQKGAQQLSKEQRVALANDELELLAVDGPANQQKSDGDAATWLPAYKPFRCQYIARQIAVKQKYELWVTQAEYDAMLRVLVTCPDQRLPQK